MTVREMETVLLAASRVEIPRESAILAPMLIALTGLIGIAGAFLILYVGS